MFNPSRDQVRSFFIDTWRKYQAKEVLTPMETIAADIIAHHPEYHTVVEDPEAVTATSRPRPARSTPSCTCRCTWRSRSSSRSTSRRASAPPSRPPASTAATATTPCTTRSSASARCSSTPSASGTPPDGAAYVGALRKRAGLAI